MPFVVHPQMKADLRSMNARKMENTLWTRGAAMVAGTLGTVLLLFSLAGFSPTPYLSLLAMGSLMVCFTLIFLQSSQAKKENRTLISRETLLDTVFENVAVGIGVYDENYKLVKWNRKYIDLVGLDEAQLTPDTTFHEVLDLCFDHYVNVGDDKDQFIAGVVEAIENLPTGVVDRHFTDGRIVKSAFNKRPEGGFVLTLNDVTTNRMAQQALRENEDRYRSMVELSPDAIVAHKGGFMIYVNEAALDLFKVKGRHDLIGQKISSYFPFSDGEALAPYFSDAEDAGMVNNLPSLKSKVIREDGTQTNVEMEASALLYGERNVLQLVIRDISAQMQIEEFLKQAKDEAEYAAQLKGKFLANMSHELRTPLNAVIGFSEVIISQIFGAVGNPKYLEYAHDINSSGHHLLDLINDILDFSKIEAGEQKIKEEEVEIDVLVNECIRLTQQNAIDNDINIKLEFDPLLPQIFADRRMIKQILINLLSNAIKFTPTGGRIITSVHVLENAGVRISVSDNGIGIREDDIERALTPFVQVDNDKSRKYHGTGLGLPLSKNLAELHDGRLELSSRYGEGTEVSLYLPQDRVRRKAA
ncbi:ATP-binding protein [uncultured Sneathiella sp.]|uniref:PAS domain-containing sensor histidine kinase n=1 Tax=uncultured Sneathiella sp. TaxID=879315 RepID=UPI0030DCF249|tara:strand:+ start:1485 stop:3242 length:1758 start_codon:yes stop_codon:yes gene_type:complete